MTDEDVFEPHSSLANLDFVKGHIENSEKTKLDWIGLFAFFLIIFLSGTNWKPLLQRRISNTQEPSLVFFSSMSIVKDVAHQKMKKKTKEKRKSENKDFYQSGYLLTAKKETPKSLSSTDPLWLLFWRSKFSNGRAQRERDRTFLQYCCCLTVEVEVEVEVEMEMGEENTWQVGFVFLMGPSWMNETD